MSVQELMIVDLEERRTGYGDVGPAAVTLRSPVCGDEVTIEPTVEDGTVVSVVWSGKGCTVSMAAAGALAALTPGLTLEQFASTSATYVELVHGAPPSDDLEREFDELPELGDAVAFAGLGRIPLRAGCATLAWRAMQQALALA